MVSLSIAMAYPADGYAFPVAHVLTADRVKPSLTARSACVIPRVLIHCKSFFMRHKVHGARKSASQKQIKLDDVLCACETLARESEGAMTTMDITKRVADDWAYVERQRARAAGDDVTTATENVEHLASVYRLRDDILRAVRPYVTESDAYTISTDLAFWLIDDDKRTLSRVVEHVERVSHVIGVDAMLHAARAAYVTIKRAHAERGQ